MSDSTPTQPAKTSPGASPVLLELLAARGPSGYEQAPAAVWSEAASSFAQVSTDLVGTPLALVAPKHGFESSPRRLLVMGHIDEIGLIVTHIDDEGYLWFRPVGGWDAQILVGQRLAIDTRGSSVGLPPPNQERSMAALSSEASRVSRSRQVSTAALASWIFSRKSASL